MRVKLSDLYDIGSSKRVFQSEWRKSGVPFYRAREIAKLSIDGYVDNELFIDEDLYLEYIDKYGKPEAGDVMVTGVGTLGVCYVVKQEDRFYFKDGNILWFKQKAKDRILPEYLVKAFDSKDVKEFIDKNSSGTTVGTFTIQTAKKMEISLPSIEEQRNIIQKITKIESVIKQRRQELQLLDDLIKARFVELFGDPVLNPFSWEMKRFDEICENLDSRRKPISSGDRVEGIYPYYGASGIVDYVEDYIFNEDILLVSEDGANLLMRSTPIAFSVSGKVWVNNHAHVVRFDKMSLQKYVEIYFSLIDISDSITGSAQPKLNQAKLNAIMLPIPEDMLLDRYCEFLYQVNKSKFVERFLELSLFYGLSSPLNSEMICIFPYF